ncbi:MAG: hypothetical protein Q9173_003845 [Seirophora scorigena]
MTTQASHLMIDAQVQRQLLQWNKDLNFKNLWIHGPYETSNPSQNTLAAGCLDLRPSMPLHLHCVINGVQHLDDRDDEQHSRSLQRVLSTLTSENKHIDKADSHKNQERAPDRAKEVPNSLQTTKTCFTTDGYVDALAQLVEQDCLRKFEFSDEAEQRPEEDAGLMPRRSDNI